MNVNNLQNSEKDGLLKKTGTSKLKLSRKKFVLDCVMPRPKGRLWKFTCIRQKRGNSNVTKPMVEEDEPSVRRDDSTLSTESGKSASLSKLEQLLERQERGSIQQHFCQQTAAATGIRVTQQRNCVNGTMPILDVTKPTVGEDEPSVKGKFTWEVIGTTVVPCILKTTGAKFVAVRMSETLVLSSYLERLNVEVFNCVSVKSFSISEAEAKLLNDINKQCENRFGRPFQLDSSSSDYIVRLEDLIEFYGYIETCYNKLMAHQNGTTRTNKCGFVRINDDSVVPYAVKKGNKYVPLFYFEGETDNLRSKAINLENWDLAYLKFCCKVQGIKNELFASEQCLVTSLDDVKSYFPEGTKFEDYWPAKISDMQAPARTEVNGQRSWVQTPVGQTVKKPSVQTRVVPSSMVNGVVTQTAATGAVGAATAAAGPAGQQYSSTNWSVVMNSPQYSVQHMPRGQKTVHNPNVTMMNSNNTMNAARNYVNQTSDRQAPPQYYSSVSGNMPLVNNRTPHHPSLVRVTVTNSTANTYTSTQSDRFNGGSMYTSVSSAQSPYIYQQQANAQQHMTSAKPSAISAILNSSSEQQNTRYPPGLTPISTVLTMQSQQQQHHLHLQQQQQQQHQQQQLQHQQQQQQQQQQQCGLPTGSPTTFVRSMSVSNSNDVIDLCSSPPPRPPSVHHQYIPTPSSYHSPVGEYRPLIEIPEDTLDSQYQSGSVGYQIKNVLIRDKSITAINHKPFDFAGQYLATVQDLNHTFFPKAGYSMMRKVLDVTSTNLYKPNSAQKVLLMEHGKVKSIMDEVPLILVDDIESKYKVLLYVLNMKANENTNGVADGMDAKRMKMS